MQQTVMIVDDSIPVHVLMKKQLEPERLSFHSVYDGKGALPAAITVRPDLILLDVDMPGADGFQACQFLKSNPLTAGIPLIFVSGDSLVADKVKGLELGAIDYITKPFKPDELRARIRTALRSKPVLPDGQMAGGLKGVWVKPYFDLLLKAQLAQSQRHKRPLTCVVAELTCLANNHTRMESQTVNEIIRSVGRALVLRCRTEDTILQFENGRFVLLLGDTSRHAASKMIERLREDLTGQFSVAETVGIDVSCSFGISDTEMTTGDKLLNRATLAANRAKRRGGNSIAIARANSAG